MFRADIDPLNLYVTMVSLSYFQISNAHTLSIIFQRDLLDPTWQAAYKLQVRDMLVSYLQQQPALTHSSGASVRSAAS
jgi:hypothetical protein